MQFLKSISTIIAQISEQSQHNKEQFSEALKKFNNPFAEQVSWLPLKSGGSNFQTNILLQDEQGNLFFTASWGIRIFSFIFIGVGIIAFIVLLPIFLQSYNGGNPEYALLLPMILFPLIFTSIGIIIFITSGRKKVFDFQYGYFYIGKMPDDTMDTGIYKKLTPLRNVRGVQILAEDCSGSKGSRYRSYEINLVLQDMTRVNVIDHGDISQIVLDAQKIASSLRVPLWDMSSFRVLTYIPSLFSPKIEDDKNQKLL